MDKENKKNKVEHQKVGQKKDLQYPQESVDNTPEVNEQESEKNTVEKPDVIEGMVYCKSCKKEVEPYHAGHNRWRCPDCNKYTQSPDMKGKDVENLKEVVPSKDRPYQILSSRNIKFSGNELAQAEMLIESGVASNFNELAKKAFNILFLKEKVNKAFGVENKMELNNEPDPKRTMKEIQEQKLMEAYINSIDGGSKADPMATMMMMRMMENQNKGKDSGSNGFMDKILEMKMMQTMMGGQNSETAGLQKEIAELKHNMQMQQMLNQQQQQQQGNQSSQEFLQQMERIRSERDMAVKGAEINAQKERDKNLQLAYDNRKIELENRLKSLEKDKQKSNGTLSSQKIKEMKEEIAAVKEMSTILGDREKGSGEMLMDNLGNVAEKVLPALVELGKNKQQQPVQQPVYQVPQIEQPQELSPPIYEQPQELLPQQPNLEPQNYDGLTPTEKEMSEQMSNMYLHTSGNKK